MEALYTTENCKPAYRLLWSLALFWKAPAPNVSTWLSALQAAVEPDGVRILEHHQRSPTVSQFLVSAKCPVSPAETIRSVKGRLQYLVRREVPKAFQRNYSIKSVGEVKRAVVEAYVRSQLNHHVMADERVQQALASFQIPATDVDLSASRRSSHGEFVYNLHLVFVHEERWHEIRPEVLERIRSMIVRASKHKSHLLSSVGLLSDHVHLTLGCSLTESPLEVALGYLNNLAYAQGMRPVYQYGFYAGTFGEYDLGAIRRNLGG
jgi:REP element-mobilizing transposase RayT